MIPLTRVSERVKDVLDAELLTDTENIPTE